MFVSIPLVFTRVAKDELPLTSGSIGHGDALSRRLPPALIRVAGSPMQDHLLMTKSVIKTSDTERIRCCQFKGTLTNPLAWAWQSGLFMAGLVVSLLE